MQVHPRGKSNRMPPGIVISFLLHFGLVSWLTVMLAFRAPPKTPETPSDLPVIVLPPRPPPPPPPPADAKRPVFRPTQTDRIVNVGTAVQTVPIPPALEIIPPSSPQTPDDEHPVVKQPKVLSRTNPTYPDRAVDNNISGYVDIEGTVEPDGSFSDGKIITEAPEGYGFAHSLLRVIPKWRFEPKTVGGKAVPYQIRYRFTFALAP